MNNMFNARDDDTRHDIALQEAFKQIDEQESEQANQCSCCKLNFNIDVAIEKAKLCYALDRSINLQTLNDIESPNSKYGEVIDRNKDTGEETVRIVTRCVHCRHCQTMVVVFSEEGVPKTDKGKEVMDAITKNIPALKIRNERRANMVQYAYDKLIVVIQAKTK